MTGAPAYLLDTNITSCVLSGRSPAARNKLREALLHGSVAISTVTEAEIRYGLELRPEAVQLRAAAERFLQLLEIRPWSFGASQAYAKLRAMLKKTGRPLAQADLMIAAHAMSTGATLVSHDKDFQHLAPYIQMTDWAQDLE